MASSRDWDRDLAKIDRQIGSMSDADLLAAAQAEKVARKETALPAGDAFPTTARTARTPGKWGVYLRVAMSLTLAIGLLFWPYSTHCGAGLFGYLLAAFMTSVTGAWGGIFSWKVRMPVMHVLSILLFAWGAVMGSMEILPRIGYAVASESHPATWFCK